jgi:hypothetical protein
VSKVRPEDSDVFRDAVARRGGDRAAQSVTSLRSKPAPIPAKRLEDEQAVLAELKELALDGDEVEMEDDATFLRPACRARSCASCGARTG